LKNIFLALQHTFSLLLAEKKMSPGRGGRAKQRFALSAAPNN